MTFQYLTHICQQDDRWDLISWIYYGDVAHIPILMAANPGVTLDPLLAQGVEIRVPIVEEPAPAVTPGLPPWRA